MPQIVHAKIFLYELHFYFLQYEIYDAAGEPLFYRRERFIAFTKEPSVYIGVRGISRRNEKEALARGFRDENEEINFFKNIKTKFSSEYVFHIDLYNFRKSCPDEDGLTIKTYVRREQKKISHYLED